MAPALPSGPAQTPTAPLARVTLRGIQWTGEEVEKGTSNDRDVLGAATSSPPRSSGTYPLLLCASISLCGAWRFSCSTDSFQLSEVDLALPRRLVGAGAGTGVHQSCPSTPFWGPGSTSGQAGQALSGDKGRRPRVQPA